MRISLPGYHNLIARCREDGSRGGVGLFIKENINYKIREDPSIFIPHVFESLFVEIENQMEEMQYLVSYIDRTLNPGPI